MTRPQRRSLWGAAGVVAAAAVAFLVLHARGNGDARGAGTKAEQAAAKAADRPVPVLVARAARRDVPVTLEGLGTVTAYKTVNVRTQVDGRLDKILFREGQTVSKGEVLAQIDPRPFEILLHQGQAALARDQAQLRGAERNLDRYEVVVQKQLIAQQQVDDQRTLVEQTRGSVAGDTAQIESARLQLDYARIKSPIDGVTGVRQVDQGNIVHAADTNPIVIVTQLDPIAVLFTLPQDDLPRVAPAMAQRPLTVEARSRDGSEALAQGQVELIDNQINQTTATMRLKALFPNPAHKLWPNQFVKARLLLDVRKGVVVIPAVAVQRGPKGTFVYVVEGEVAQARDVGVDTIQGDEVIVAKGLSEGDSVVVEGQGQLRPGAKVAARASSPGPRP